MILLENWQYKYIEKCLFNFYILQHSTLETERKMVAAIETTLGFFSGTAHEVMMHEFYFKADQYRKIYTKSGHYKHVCLDILYMEESNGYVVKREIIYKVAMSCYELHIFRSKDLQKSLDSF